MRKPWTQKEIEKLTKLYPNTLTVEIAEKLGRSTSSVAGQASKLKLRKTKEFVAELSRFYASDPNHGGRKTRFKKGTPAHNKGKKQTEFMTQKGIDRSKLTRFKKGNLPFNHKPVGSERITKDGYIEVKFAEPSKWKLKHRVVWESENGKIPKGYVVVFKDKNPLNISLSNLELVSKKENMLRNTIHNYPQELKSVLKNMNKIKKYIKNYEHH